MSSRSTEVVSRLTGSVSRLTGRVYESLYVDVGVRERINSHDAKKRRPNGKAQRNPGNVITYRPCKKTPGQHHSNREISVEDCDLEIAKNAKTHRTDEYEISGLESCNRELGKLVVRRGSCFDVKFKLSCPYDQSKDDLRIVFECGDNPSPCKGTEVELILSDKNVPNKWGAKIMRQEGNYLYVKVITPPDCLVAKWELSVDVIKKDSNNDVKVHRYEHDDPIYVIFNPWCKGDTVYMEDEKMINEYVMNETGVIFTGTNNQICNKPWNFGQFESCALDVALYLLDLVNLPMHVRGDPIRVIRELSAAVNSSDDNGILQGKWSSPYCGGRNPLSWTGSMAILEQYWETRRPVKYGQCWVFSGLCTTVARALGIPARSVTNFQSAHDTDGSITIDTELNCCGEPLPSKDSVWNFHCWNEAWMARPDLPQGYGGWQVFDSTPQETSDGVWCCGPVSVAAIKQGNVNQPYDAPFVFAEVNADRVYWKPTPCGSLKPAHILKHAVGKKISTKAVNGWCREDITNSYKHKEGSPEERAAVLKANQMASTRDDIYGNEWAEDVKFELVQDCDNTWVGQDFRFGLKMKNTSCHERTVKGRINVKTMYYTGVEGDNVGHFDINKTLKPGECYEMHGVVFPYQYLAHLKDGCMFDVTVFATVCQTNEVFVTNEVYRLKKQHLTITGPGEANVHVEFQIQVAFQNPLEISLTECVVTVDGLAKNMRFPQKNVGPKGTFQATLPITPRKVGHKELVAVFSSKQIDGIDMQKSVLVRSKMS